MTNACPSNRTRAVLDVNARVRTSLHRQPSNVSNHLWTSFRGFLRHSASSVFPLRGISSTDPNQHSQKEQAVAQSQPELGRNGLYMRMTLAERDSLLKHHAAKMPFYTYHLLGAYQDPHQNTVIVLSDMRDSSVDRSLTTFQHDEVWFSIHTTEGIHHAYFETIPYPLHYAHAENETFATLPMFCGSLFLFTPDDDRGQSWSCHSCEAKGWTVKSCFAPCRH